MVSSNSCASRLPGFGIRLLVTCFLVSATTVTAPVAQAAEQVPLRGPAAEAQASGSAPLAPTASPSIMRMAVTPALGLMSGQEGWPVSAQFSSPTPVQYGPIAMVGSGGADATWTPGSETAQVASVAPLAPPQIDLSSQLTANPQGELDQPSGYSPLSTMGVLALIIGFMMMRRSEV